MSERRGRSGRMVGIAEGVAAVVRRRQREREPRVALFDEAGAPRLIGPSAPGYDDLVELALRMIDTSLGPRRESADAEPAADTGAPGEEAKADAQRASGRARGEPAPDEPAA